MPKIVYQEKDFTREHLEVIERANVVIAEYAAQGYTLSLRQLYYQFVSRDWIPNTDKSYKRLGGIVSEGRRAGLIDWEAIEDRGRNLRSPATWESPADMVETCAHQFNVDFWSRQRYRPEVWVEKDALLGVLEVACGPLELPYFSCRGYVSDSEAWAAGRRFRSYKRAGQFPLIVHLGDHDPSGLDMTRDVHDRLTMFAEGLADVRRIALNWNQVEQYEPPPNPAKVTDSRYEGYAAEYGEESWELDALNPEILTGLIRAAVTPLIDRSAWRACEEERADGRRKLHKVAEKWGSIARRF